MKHSQKSVRAWPRIARESASVQPPKYDSFAKRPCLGLHIQFRLRYYVESKKEGIGQ